MPLMRNKNAESVSEKAGDKNMRNKNAESVSEKAGDKNIKCTPMTNLKFGHFPYSWDGLSTYFF